MGLADWFETFCSNLQVKNTTSISSRRKKIAQRLNTDYWNTTSDAAHSLYVGSYGRNTAIDGFSNLDMVMELPSSVYYQYDAYTGNGQSALLQAVRNSLAKTYSTTSIGGDGQVIVIHFTDGITFEIVPVFTNKAGNYTFPDSNGGGKWKTTNPRPEIQAIRDRNAACNGNLIPLCRMMRAWKAEWSVPMGGLLVDTLAYQFIENCEYRDKSYLYYDFISRDFFAFLADQDDEQQYWKAPGSGQYVYKNGAFQYKAKQCYNLALKAIQHDSNNQSFSAKARWRDIFGTHTRTEDSPESRRILEGQLREAYGRVVYTHKTHEKDADILLARWSQIKLAQLVLSAITAAGFIGAAFGGGQVSAFLGLIVSTVLLGLNAYTKDYDLGELAQKHKQAATDLWFIRENFLSLLTDVRMREKPIESLQMQRDDLLNQLYRVYSAAPSTTPGGYSKAQQALKLSEDMTFSDDEIDTFLPNELKRTHTDTA